MPSSKVKPLDLEMAGVVNNGNKMPIESTEAGFDPKLFNDDLKPLREQKWTVYNIFAVWMTDVHSVAGYMTAGSLFTLHLASWQVFLALIIGILLVQFFCNLVAKPCQVTGVPYPVINRAIFGIRGANVPAILRGSIAIAWYGVQTHLASKALVMVLLKFWPTLGTINDVHQYGFVGLSLLGWIAYGILWAVQAAVFWKGMDAIRRFIDWAGPAVYVLMMALAIYLVAKVGVANLSLNLNGAEIGKVKLNAIINLANLGDQSAAGGFLQSFPAMMSAIALVVSYFSGPMLNFGDFSRYAKSWETVKCGNLLGLPVNFLFFSILTLLTTSATRPLYGQLITDPIELVDRIGNPFVVIVGGLTFVIATVGINIVANFISPAFDFSNLAPRYISWRAGGMITAICSVLLTPWNWYNNPSAIHYTLGVLGALIGPLHGILVAGYYISSRQLVWVPAMYSSKRDGRYWFWRGFNPNALCATAIAGFAISSVLMPKIAEIHRIQINWLSDYSWFIGCFLGFFAFLLLERINPRICLGGKLELATDGKKSRGGGEKCFFQHICL